MADSKISALTAYTNPDPVNDVLPIVDTTNTTTKKISRNNLLGITSAPVGKDDTQTLTAKTLTAPTINGATLSGTLSGTYTIGGTPTFPASVVTLTGSQTLTNKILTSPTINSPTITNASITADAITGFSSANTGTIYGVAVTSSKIPGTSLTNSSVGASQLNTGASIASVATSQTTASTTYTDLATTGPAVTVTIGANGLALVIITATVANNTAGDGAVASWVASGANTIAVADAQAFYFINSNLTSAGNASSHGSAIFLATGLATGSTTFTAKYRAAGGGTATFDTRSITVIPL